LIGDAASQVAEKAGVARSTVTRDGERVANLARCTTSVQRTIGAGNVKVSDAEIKTLVDLKPAEQNAVATALRKGQASSVREAMKAEKIKTPVKPSRANKEKPAMDSAFTSKAQLEEYVKAMKRWLGTSPTIDEWRKKWPHVEGDQFVQAISDAVTHGNKWKRVIK